MTASFCPTYYHTITEAKAYSVVVKCSLLKSKVVGSNAHQIIPKTKHGTQRLSAWHSASKAALMVFGSGKQSQNRPIAGNERGAWFSLNRSS